MQPFHLCNTIKFCAILLTTFATKTMANTGDRTWDINLPCRPAIEQLASAFAEMTECAILNSAPPQICIQCVDQYIGFRQELYSSQHLKEKSVDNKSCSEVIYDKYVLSYGKILANTITKEIWDASKCDSCLQIDWDFEHENTTIHNFDNKTLKFLELYGHWHSCVDRSQANQTAVCSECTKQFDALYEHYWKIYLNPDVFFCVDVDSAMDDSLTLWHNVWKCKDETKDLQQDIRVALFSVTMLVIVIALFYAGSYIQTEQAQANLIQYSQVPEPRGQRSRLLSSSTLDSSLMQTPSSSQHGWNTER